MQAKVWQEDVVIPTYPVGKLEKNPMFIENRVYQGSSGAVYPHPVIEKVYDEKTDVVYKALFLENKYLKIMILPELGGRIQRAYDKIRKRDFIYYNRVIKPALVGLTGPWISGGIEFNWPQHHRPSTFDPVDWKIEENRDGSCTIWINEVERMFRTKGMAGFTLYPDRAYLEIKVQLYNRTLLPQTFLWWANPAVHVNDFYQSVFPPDVHAVFDHGKRDVSEFPIARGTYYKVNYAPGTDISFYKNIPVPTSYMCIKSSYDFVGGYEHDKSAGILHVADHHISPGKKQWTWGNGDFGKAWERNLTDEDGPYIELMTGVFTDNQPDFSWLMPNEEKSFVQYFMPYSEIGLVKNASKDALVNLEVENRTVVIKLYTTAVFKNARIVLLSNYKTLLEKWIDISPEQPVTLMTQIVDIPLSGLRVILFDADGKELVSFQQSEKGHKIIPKPSKPALPPNQIKSIEQLFLTGLHIEQYRHATFRPEDYYEEALRREPGNVRCNNAMGLLCLRRGLFEEAENYFQNAIRTLTERNPNPYDGEPYYNLGISLLFQGKVESAYDAFHKALWNAAWMDNGYFSLARIQCGKAHFGEALDLVNRSLVRNWHHHQARHLRTVVLRKLGHIDEALEYVEESLHIDAFNIGCLFEKYLLLKRDKTEPHDVLNRLIELQRGSIYNYIEYALDYGWAELYDEAVQLLAIGIENCKNTSPLAWYFSGWFYHLKGDAVSAKEMFTRAATSIPDYCFPNQLEAVPALECAMRYNPSDSRAPYYLGNFWYDKRQYEKAADCWERSAALNDSFPTVYRNLALVYYTKYKQPEKAMTSLEKAFKLDSTDSRVFMELDQLSKRLNYPVPKRLERLERHIELTCDRDDLFLERITLCNIGGDYEKAYNLLQSRKFHPWEGGEGKVSSQYVFTNIELAKQAMAKENYSRAQELLNACFDYPENLGEGKLFGTAENEIYYYRGCVCEALGKKEDSETYFIEATKGLSEPNQAFFYYDQPPDTIFFQGLALEKLGRKREAKKRYTKLISYGRKNLNKEVKIDYFAVSLPDLLIFEDDLNIRNQIHCQFMMALGFIGMNELDAAQECIRRILKLNNSHQKAISIAKTFLQWKELEALPHRKND